MERRLAAIMVADMVGYSRLIETDQDGTLTRQKAYRKELIDPEIVRNRGRIVKTTGDGMLAEFSSAQDAVRCAIDIQAGMNRREADEDDDSRIQYRIGINLGDVVFDEDDIFGDGVNIAARLEGLAQPGGVCISDIVHQTMLDLLNEPFRDMGGQRVKNISRPIRVWQWTPDAPVQRVAPEMALKQRVQFTTSADGTHIAWASVGEGLPILKAPHWLNHIEYEWGSPVWGAFLTEIARNYRLIRFDQRGNGLSDWEPPRIDHDSMLEDMEEVADAAGLNRFVIFGMSQGASTAVRYAVKHPDRVSALVIFGGYMRGRLNRGNADDEKYVEAGLMMMREGWGSPSPVYRNFFTSNFVPDASREVSESWDELQRVSVNAENAIKIWDMNNRIDTVEVAKQVRVPTLVLHTSGDRVVPVSEGRLTARLIPGANFAELPGNDHVALEGHPCFDMFFDEVRAFLAEHGSS
jgi:class 3 adenylate cyclase/pimeloyl-ACP methyl ester carboxylesterase